jgi:hypothetical protein
MVADVVRTLRRYTLSEPPPPRPHLSFHLRRPVVYPQSSCVSLALRAPASGLCRGLFLKPLKPPAAAKTLKQKNQPYEELLKDTPCGRLSDYGKPVELSKSLSYGRLSDYGNIPTYAKRCMMRYDQAKTKPRRTAIHTGLLSNTYKTRAL